MADIWAQQQYRDISSSCLMTSTICLFKLVHLDGLRFDEWVNHVVKELNVEEALKSSILVVQKAAAAAKTWVEFCQGSNGTIRSSVATSYDVSRLRRNFFFKLCRNQPTNRHTYS